VPTRTNSKTSVKRAPRTLGIDPGTVVTGYGIIDPTTGKALDYGCIKPPRKLLLSERYDIIYRGVNALIEKYQPEALAVETQYVGKNVQSALKLGMATGIVILVATRNNLPIFAYSPSKVKSAVVGNGRASKEQIQGMMQKLLGLSQIPEPDDAADALALAFCHIEASKSPLAGTHQV